MDVIMAALRSGIAPGVVHSMVDMAAAALRLTAPAPSPSSPARHRTLPADTLHPPVDQPSHPSPTRPYVSSPKQAHSQAKKGVQSAGLKAVLKTAAGREPAEHNMAGRAAADAAAQTEAPAVVDAPYRYHNVLLLLLLLLSNAAVAATAHTRGGSCYFDASGFQIASKPQTFFQTAPNCIIILTLLLMQNSMLA